MPLAPPPGRVLAKHLRSDPPAPGDGTRILVSRYHPRGISREARTWAEWRPELGPSRALHAAVKGGSIGLDAYDRRFLSEMEGPEARRALDALAARVAAGETVTLLCDHPRSLPAERCHRFLVQRLLLGLLRERLGRAGAPGG